MAWLLTAEEFTDAGEAVRAGDITQPLYDFIARIVHVNARSNLHVPSLSPTGNWDREAEMELVQDWFSQRLLTGALLRAFDRCATPAALARYLEAALRNWMRDRARSQQRPRLLVRARELLEAQTGFVRFAEGPSWLDDAWGRSKWDAPKAHSSDVSDLIAAAYGLGDIELLRFSGDGADPVISNADLLRLLESLFDRGGELLTLRQIDEVIRARFAHAFIEELPTDRVPEVQIAEPDVFDDVAAEETAQRIVASLTPRQLRVLVGRVGERKTLEELSEELGCSRGTVDNEAKRAGARVREAVADDDQLDLILEKVLNLAL